MVCYALFICGQQQKHYKKQSQLSRREVVHYLAIRGVRFAQAAVSLLGFSSRKRAKPEVNAEPTAAE